jgi:hypothetical protein
VYKQIARPAKVGETIEIVNPQQYRSYSAGKRAKVTSVYSTGVYVDGILTFINHDEYVVLIDITAHNVLQMEIDYQLMTLNDAIQAKEEAERQIAEAKARLTQLRSEYAALPEPV